MIITKRDMREITKDNFLTNRIARAILICAQSNPVLHTAFLQLGALVTLRRRFLHNEMNEYDKKIIALSEWAIDEYGLPEVKDAGKSEVVGRVASADGAKPRLVITTSGPATSRQVH